MRLAGKTIFISGATSAIGEAIARSCAEAGARLIISGRNAEKLDECAARLGPAVADKIALDFYHRDQMKVEITLLHGRFRISGFVHVAGLHEIAPLKVTRPDHLIRAFQINTVAGIELSRLLAHPKLIDTAHGTSHMFLSSVASHRAEPGLLAYSTAKAALNAAARGLAVELAPKNVRINTLTLGWVNTPAAQRTLAAMGEARAALQSSRYPLGFGEVADVTAGALFLLSEDSRWMTGSELVMDGGLLA